LIKQEHIQRRAAPRQNSAPENCRCDACRRYEKRGELGNVGCAHFISLGMKNLNFRRAAAFFAGLYDNARRSNWFASCVAAFPRGAGLI